ncbi:MAG TPA: M20/M25/M40 family metallo-hydrolase [Candidatus Acidoferrales bacterium]
MRFVAACMLFVLASLPVAAQGWLDHLARFTETPTVTGYEEMLAAEIRARLKDFSPQTDNLGNVYVTLGSGAPHRLIVAPMDEPGYVVSGITPDGYLRVQRLPQNPSPHGLFDLLHAAQPVVIYTRGGKWISGIVAGRSTHIQGGRRDAPRGDHPDEMYIDIGASTAEEVRKAGVDILDPIAAERTLYRMGYARLTASAVGDRFGAVTLVELLSRMDRSKIAGTLTIAFAAKQYATSRGLDRLLQHVRADEMVYAGRLLPRRGGFRQQAQEPRVPRLEPGSGVLIASAAADATGAATLSGLPAELQTLATTHRIPAATDYSAPLGRVSYTRGPVLPERFAHVGVGVAWGNTPAEFIHGGDVAALVALLEAYVTGGVPSQSAAFAFSAAQPLPAPALPEKPTARPSNTEILRRLVEAYGMSGAEGAVRAAVERLLPPWAKAETDERGNLLVHVRGGGAVSGPRIVFAAHIDEIGYLVRSVADDGRLVVQSRGGGIIEFFAGHTMFVHTAAGIRPGVMELPEGWDRPNFEWPRGQAAQLRVDVGARSPGEVEQLGVRVGDPITVPKKYRPLYGTRANGRSFDDRVGSAAQLAAMWALGDPSKWAAGRDITFAWVVEEEVGLLGAFAVAERMAKEGRAPDYVFAVDTFVSADSPLESKRFGDAPIGQGFVIRAIDNSNIVPRAVVDRLIEMARSNKILVQYGATGGGNDGAVFLRHGTVDVPISWPLRYSHSPAEVIDTRDYDALAAIIAVLSRSW